MNKRNKDRKLLTSSQCSFAYTWRNKTTSPVKKLFLLTNEFPPFVKKMPIWFTWKAKENFITCLWYLARRKKITGILGSKSEWMIELRRVVCPFQRYNFCKELCQWIPTENIACDYKECNTPSIPKKSAYCVLTGCSVTPTSLVAAAAPTSTFIHPWAGTI